MNPFQFYNPVAVDKKKQQHKHTNCVGDCSEYTLSHKSHDHYSQGQVDLMRNSSEAETSLLIKAELGVETETSAIMQDLSYFGSGRSHNKDVSTVESIEMWCLGNHIQCW
uniref:Uncharacterized protein n=1 Tax=Coccidioides posadasii RMSCC 3488 TaxID=454284 RepID=A0A0J6FHV2_COCPO|nr:hypothetical protein CPAG_05278 [Coccidioides posadasii RMSCC 3488]